MRKFLRRANHKLTVSTAAWLLSGSYLLSSLLGLLRERLLNANFAQLDGVLDAYRVAFKIPDLAFYLLVSGALSVTFIPVFSEFYGKGKKKDAWEITSGLFNLLGIGTIVISIFIFIFAPQLVELTASGENSEVKELATSLMRIIAINPFLFAISSILASTQQALGRFFFNAFAPVLYNLGIIFGIVYLSDSLGIGGAAVGVVIGAILQLLFQFLGMAGLGFQYNKKPNYRKKGLHQVLIQLPKRSLDQGLEYFVGISETRIASYLRGNAINAYEVAIQLRTVPVNLIGVAIATAAFPKISQRAHSMRTDLFRKELHNVLRVVLWLAIPAATIAFFLRGYLARLLTATTGELNDRIAQTLGWFTLAIVFRVLFHIVTRGFYAQQDVKTPLMVSVFMTILNIGLAAYLGLVAGFGLSGLAAAYSATSVIEVVTLLSILQKRHGKIIDGAFLNASLRMLVAGAVAGAACYLMVRYVTPLRATDAGIFTLLPKFTFMVIVTLTTYIGASLAFKIDEVKPLIKTIEKFIFKPLGIQFK